MLYYLDTNIVIYAVEGQAALRQRARNHLASLEAAGHRFVISELTWTECLVYPYRTTNGTLLLDYQQFFLAPLLTTVPLTATDHHRAAMIRGVHNYGLADSLHLAAAVEYRCDRFLTNDQHLAAFPDIPVELLP
ncbi:MAG TPA: type II toxin-antitoxin system VapC family toxin [Gemmataceae bacterium]|nr:type II toxin-antitoxin system VapC family toxin [Gemmataceae bacterium]